MKSKIHVTESELVDVIDLIIEESNAGQYDEEDYIDVFLEIFKPWIKNILGDSWRKYPISQLINKYYDEFVNSYNIDSGSYNWMNLTRKMAKTGRDLVEKGVYELPSLEPTEFFTEKNKKILNYFLNQIGVPPYIEVSLDEDKPYQVTMKSNVNWLDMISSPENSKIVRPSRIHDELVKVLENYMGITTRGKTIYGELFLDMSTPQLLGVDEWVKQILNKEIKSELKKSDAGRYIHSLSFKPDSSRLMGEFKIRMKSNAGWSQRNAVRDKLKEILKNKGYNLKFFEIEN